VEAQWGDGWYAGKVRKILATGGVQVEWDGDEPEVSDVQLSCVRAQGEQLHGNATPEEAMHVVSSDFAKERLTGSAADVAGEGAGLQVGQAVEAQWGDGWYAGKVRKILATGGVQVEWDGDEPEVSDVQLSCVRPQGEQLHVDAAPEESTGVVPHKEPAEEGPTGSAAAEAAARGEQLHVDAAPEGSTGVAQPEPAEESPTGSPAVEAAAEGEQLHVDAASEEPTGVAPPEPAEEESPTGSAAVEAAAQAVLRVGQAVEAQWQDEWYGGEVRKIWATGDIQVEWDGDEPEVSDVPPSCVRPRGRTSSLAAGGLCSTPACTAPAALGCAGEPPLGRDTHDESTIPMNEPRPHEPTAEQCQPPTSSSITPEQQAPIKEPRPHEPTAEQCQPPTSSGITPEQQAPIKEPRPHEPTAEQCRPPMRSGITAEQQVPTKEPRPSPSRTGAPVQIPQAVLKPNTALINGLDTELPLHKQTTEKLRDMVSEKGITQHEHLDREKLMEALRLLSSWDEMSTPELEKYANVHGIDLWAEGLVGSLADRLATQMLGKPRKPAVSVAAEREGTPSRTTNTSKATPATSSSLPRAPADRPAERTTNTSTAPPATSSSLPRAPADRPAERATSRDQWCTGTLPFEVARIKRALPMDYCAILSFCGGERPTIELANSHYRQLMRLLHPDKRTREDDCLAGGKEAVDLALVRVQEALRLAKQALEGTAAAAAFAPAGRTKQTCAPKAPVAPVFAPGAPAPTKATWSPVFKPNGPVAPPQQPAPPPPPAGKPVLPPFGNGPARPLSRRLDFVD